MATPTSAASTQRRNRCAPLRAGISRGPSRNTPPIAQPDKPAPSEPPKSIDTVPAATLPVATPTSAAPTQMAESLRATESRDLAEDLRGAPPPIAQPDRPTPLRTTEEHRHYSRRDSPRGHADVRCAHAQAESLRATESTDLAEDLRGASPPIAQPDRPAPPELLKSIDTVPAPPRLSPWPRRRPLRPRNRRNRCAPLRAWI